jgi:2-hydroxychromene-2-carboxylate isomerase
MPAPIDFYFDFSSPYGYLASTQIEALAAKHGRAVTWHPFLLGAVFKLTGAKPLTDMPMKSDYFKRDFQRSAGFYGVPFTLPSQFPFAAVAASRAFFWLHDQDPALAKAFAQAVLRASFVEGQNVSGAETVIDIAGKLGIDAETLRAALNDPAVKERLKIEVDKAVEAGVFGSPFIVIDGEQFWGADRLAQIERWLANGKW